MLLREVFDIRAWHIPLARALIRAGRLSTAEKAYRRVLAWQPDQNLALAGLGRMLLLQRRFEEAVDVWQRAVALEPHRRNPAFQLARALHRSGRFDAAAKQYIRVLAIDPLHDKAFAALEELSDRLARPQPDGSGSGALDAVIALAEQMLALEDGSARPRSNALALLAAVRSRSDPEAAMALWAQLAELNPRSIGPPLQMARIRQRQQRHDEAQLLFGTVLEREPNHAEALAGFGRALAATDREAALQHFSAWAQRRPRDIVPWLEMAQLHQQAQAWEAAEDVYREILNRVADNRSALSRFAQVISRDPGRLEQALDLWRRIAERDVAASFPLVQRAYLLERTRRPGEAEGEYRAALRRAPKDTMALIGLARLLSGQARWAEAEPLFDALHEVNPGRSDALLGLGRCLERLDRGDEALAAYRKVLAIDPANAGALLYSGRLLRQAGQIEEAIAIWRQVSRQTPHNADAWHELVFMLAGAERDAEALAALDAAEAALPASPGSWVRLGLAAQAGQFNDRAIAYFERAIAAEPQEARHHARLGQFYQRLGILDGAFHHLLDSRELAATDLAVTKQLVDTVHALNVVGVDHLEMHRAPRRQGEVLVPERLFQRVRDIADKQVVPYQPVPRRIIAVSASLAGGGAERQLVNLLRGLSVPSLSLDLALFCLSLARRTRRDFFLPLLADTSVDIVTPDEGATEACLSVPDVAPHARLIRAFPPDMAGPIAFWLQEFNRRRPEIVHAWQDSTNLMAVVAALLAGVPRIVLSARSVRPDNPRRRLKRFMREGYQAVLGHPSVILSTNSHAGADDYAEWLGVDRATVEVIHNGIDFDELARDVDPSLARSIRDRLGIPPEAPVMGSAFRMSEEKRPLLWVETAAEVARREPQTHFIICGDGPMRLEMIDLAARLGIADRLHLLGPQDNIGSYYKAMDVVLLTSRHEGLPNVLLEAQSLGIPVVAPDVGGISEAIWQGVTGWAVGAADAKGLAERAVFCLKDPAWLAKARAEAPSFVRKRFGVDAMLRRTLEVYGLANR